MSRGDRGADLRAAFQYEVRPDVYMVRVWWTAGLVCIGYLGMLTYRNGAVVPDLVLPLATWHARNAEGSLYMEVWATAIANGLQVGFGVWGAWLILMGLWRLVINKRLVRAAFGLGIAFAVAALSAPYGVAAVFRFAIAKWPPLGG